VGVRDFACRIGESLSLVGYAKNLPDGTVEIAAQGEEGALAEFEKRISVRAPFGIHVKGLSVLEKRKIQAREYASFGVSY
jgi:acylphosphatase